MNKYKYIICIIFGILLFLLWNRINGFSIGNQYGLDYTGTPLTSSDPNVILLDMFNKCYIRGNICTGNLDSPLDFSACQRAMLRLGGDCQLNTIIGLYSTLGIPFSSNDQRYINSVGRNLPMADTLPYIYDYLTNRESMRDLLFQNTLNPQRLSTDENGVASSFNYLSKNKLYPILVGAKSDGIFTMNELYDAWSDDSEEEKDLEYAHNLLIYKTDFDGLKSFRAIIPSIVVQDQDLHIGERRQSIQNLDHSITLLNSAHLNTRTNGNVCIMIDFCQKKFYVVTELDYPSTVAFLNDDGTLGDDARAMDEYKTLWMLKINIKYLVIQRIVTLQSTLLPLASYNLNIANIHDNSDDLLNLWKNNYDFRQTFLFYAYIPETKDSPYQDASNVVFKSQDTYYGKLNRLCKDEGPDPRCDPDLYCNEGVERLGTQFDICVPNGSEGAPCIKSRMGRDLDPSEYQCSAIDLYCNQDAIQDDGSRSDICVKIGTEGAPCRDAAPSNKCDSGLYCYSRMRSGADYDMCVKYGFETELCRDTDPKCDSGLYCLNIEDGSERCIEKKNIVLKLTQKRLSIVDPLTLALDLVNQSGFIYEYNDDFSIFNIHEYVTGIRKEYFISHLPSLNQLKQHMIYLGDFQKYSSTTFLGMGRWQKRSFFLEWNNVDGKFYLMYCIPNIVMSSSDNIVLDIKGRLPTRTYTTHYFYKVGKHDDTEPDKYITIYFEDGTERPYLELNTVSMLDQLTPSNNLIRILEYVNELLLERRSILKACAARGK
jgi:hypothetical protein